MGFFPSPFFGATDLALMRRDSRSTSVSPGSDEFPQPFLDLFFGGEKNGGVPKNKSTIEIVANKLVFFLLMSSWKDLRMICSTMYGGLFETKGCLKAPGNIMSSCQDIIDTLALAHSFRPTHLPKKTRKKWNWVEPPSLNKKVCKFEHKSRVACLNSSIGHIFTPKKMDHFWEVKGKKSANFETKPYPPVN